VGTGGNGKWGTGKGRKKRENREDRR